jgi:hypothetical protein
VNTRYPFFESQASSALTAGTDLDAAAELLQLAVLASVGGQEPAMVGAEEMPAPVAAVAQPAIAPGLTAAPAADNPPAALFMRPENLEEDAAAVKAAFAHLTRGQLFLSPQNRLGAKNLKPALVWTALDRAAAKIDVWAQITGRPAPAWFFAAARDVLRHQPGVGEPRPKQAAVLQTAHATALAEVLLDLAPHQALPLLQQEARKAGVAVKLLDGSQQMFNELLQLDRDRAGQLTAWLGQLGRSAESVETVVLDALASYGPTQGWMQALDDEFGSLRQENRGSAPVAAQEQALKLAVAMRSAEVFSAIPAALKETAGVFRGDATRRIDTYFPTRTLLKLRSYWDGRNPDANLDLQGLLAAVPIKNAGAVNPEAVERRHRFYRNYAFWALGGCDHWDNADKFRLFGDITNGDIVPRDADGAIQWPDSVLERMSKLRRFVDDALGYQPPIIAEALKFLVAPSSLESQLRMVGSHLAGTPYRHLLLRPGPLCLLGEGILSRDFETVQTKSFVLAIPEGLAVLPFTTADRAQVRELAALTRLSHDPSLKALSPVLSWVQEQGARQLDAWRISPFERQWRENLLVMIRDLPASMIRNSVGAKTLGLLLAEKPTTEVHEALTRPPLFCQLMLGGLKSVLLQDGEDPASPDIWGKAAQVRADSARLLGNPVFVESLERAETWLGAIDQKWTNSPNDWKDLMSALAEPVFREPIPAGMVSQLESRLGPMLGLDIGVAQELAFTHEDRAALATALRHQVAQEELFGRRPPHLATVLQAAAVLESKKIAPEAMPAPEPTDQEKHWRRRVDELRELVFAVGSVVITPLPEKLHHDAARPRSVRVEPASWTARGLVELAGKVSGLGSHELALPAVPQEDGRWRQPATWREVAANVNRREMEVARVFGQTATLDQLPRLLELLAVLHPEGGGLLGKAVEVSRLLLEVPAAGSLQGPEEKAKAMGRLLDAWRKPADAVFVQAPIRLQTEHRPGQPLIGPTRIEPEPSLLGR